LRRGAALRAFVNTSWPPARMALPARRFKTWLALHLRPLVSGGEAG
jgi:hypothetical protein